MKHNNPGADAPSGAEALRLLTGRIVKLERKKCRGAWGVAELEYYAQAKGDPKKRKTSVPVVGSGVALFTAGDRVDVVGGFERTEYGTQFKAARIALAPPDTDAEMDKWFTATLPNIDAVRLAEMRKLAGPTPLHIFLSKPDAETRLVSIPGITAERAALIVSTWKAAASLHDNFHRLTEMGLTTDEIRTLLRRSIDISDIGDNPFLLFDEQILSLSRLDALLRNHFPKLRGSTQHRAYLVVHSIRELTQESSSTAARLADVVEHVQLRARSASVARVRELAAQHPEVFTILGDRIQLARLAADEDIIAEYIRRRAVT